MFYLARKLSRCLINSFMALQIGGHCRHIVFAICYIVIPIDIPSFAVLSILFMFGHSNGERENKWLRGYIVRFFLFWVNFSLKSLLSGFTYAHNVPDKL